MGSASTVAPCLARDWIMAASRSLADVCSDCSVKFCSFIGFSITKKSRAENRQEKPRAVGKVIMGLYCRQFINLQIYGYYSLGCFWRVGRLGRVHAHEHQCSNGPG